METTGKSGDAADRVFGDEEVAGGKFISFHVLRWRDARGVARTWETVERATGRDAVMVIPRLRPSGRVVLIRQFRPPARRWVVEFPAGLLEEGESPAVGALRELREETGYSGTIAALRPRSFTTPGLSGETVFIAQADIDEAAPENVAPRSSPDDGEMIETIVLPREELPAFYERECGKGTSFDSKVAAYILAQAELS